MDTETTCQVETCSNPDLTHWVFLASYGWCGICKYHAQIADEQGLKIIERESTLLETEILDIGRNIGYDRSLNY